jgi:phosphate transport system permease protein
VTAAGPAGGDPFEKAAMGVPGALPVGGVHPDAEDVRSAGGRTPDGRPAEGGLSGSSVRTGDRVFRAVAAGSGGLLLAVMASIAIFLIWKAIPAFTGGAGNIFTTQTWNPQGDPPVFGMAAVFFGTIVSSAIAIVIGVPIAVGVAMFIAQYASRRASTALGGLVDLLAAVPSLVFGMWGLYFLIPNTQGLQMWLSTYLGWIPIFKNESATTAGQYGKDLLIAGIILAIMIIPIVSAVTREVFLQVPQETIDAAWALGATRWEMIRIAVLPFGRAGIISASMLGLGRALGETIAVALVLNSGYKIDWQLTDPGGDTFASTIALKFGEAAGSPVAIAALIAAGLFLFVITLVVNTAARMIIARRNEFRA